MYCQLCGTQNPDEQEYCSRCHQKLLVLSGLAAAHQRGIVHGDLKPENILMAEDGAVKIGDFGLGQEAPTTDTPVLSGALGMISGTIRGTPDYIAPEVLRQQARADARADVYAIGVILFEILTGELPQGSELLDVAVQDSDKQVPGFRAQERAHEGDARRGPAGALAGRERVGEPRGRARALRAQGGSHGRDRRAFAGGTLRIHPAILRQPVIQGDCGRA